MMSVKVIVYLIQQYQQKLSWQKPWLSRSRITSPEATSCEKNFSAFPQNSMIRMHQVVVPGITDNIWSGLWSPEFEKTEEHQLKGTENIRFN